VLFVELGADGQGVAVDGDVNVLRLDAGKGRLDDERVSRRLDIERQLSLIQATRAPSGPPERLIEHAIHRVPQREDLAEW